jgi:hypothetical protein
LKTTTSVGTVLGMQLRNSTLGYHARDRGFHPQNAKKKSHSYKWIWELGQVSRDSVGSERD